MNVIAGIDEAGRGPIVGPLVMCGVALGENAEHKLKKLGVKDSKLLSPSERQKLYGAILELVTPKIIVIDVAEIDAAVFGKNGLNLNWLEAEKTAELINHLNPARAYIDLPSRNYEMYKQFLLARISNKDISLILEHKADARYVAVGAASILAKVTRDAAIEEIKKEIGIDFGSGYLSDEKTVQFLAQHYHTHAHLFRKSWRPYKDQQQQAMQKSIFAFG